MGKNVQVVNQCWPVYPRGQGYILNENEFYDPEILLCLSLFILNFKFG